MNYISSMHKPCIKNKGVCTPLPTLDIICKSFSVHYMLVFPSKKHGNYCVFLVVDPFSKMVISAPWKY